MAALVRSILACRLIACNAAISALATAMGRATRGKLSIVLYALAIPLALFVNPWIACALYVAVATIWLVPDRRMERAVVP